MTDQITLRSLGTCTVTFETCGGTAVPSQKVDDLDYVSAPRDPPEKTGYAFVN